MGRASTVNDGGGAVMTRDGHDEIAEGSAVRLALGRYGEAFAADYLISAGMTVLDRNWRCRDGEVDIVAVEGDVLVICEVKTRRGVEFGTPLDAVTPAKARGCAGWRRDGWPNRRRLPATMARCASTSCRYCGRV